LGVELVPINIESSFFPPFVTTWNVVEAKKQMQKSLRGRKRIAVEMENKHCRSFSAVHKKAIYRRLPSFKRLISTRATVNDDEN
jgi:hypothetical protein